MDVAIGASIVTITAIALLSIYQLFKSRKKSNRKLPIKTAKPSRMIPNDQEQSAAEDLSPKTPIVTVPEALQNFVLMQTLPANEMQQDQTFVNMMSEIMENLSRPHPILRDLMREIDSTQELYEIIKTDPEIAMKVLQTVNSSAFYLTQEITRLNHAILYLGMRLVKNIAFRIAIEGNQSHVSPLQRQAIEKIWRMSFIASSLGYLVAQHLKMDNSSEISTLLLFFSIGDLALVTFDDQYAKIYLDSPLIKRIRYAQQEYRTNSAIIGAHLASVWQLPQIFSSNIQYSLLPLAVQVTDVELALPLLRTVSFCYAISRITETIVDLSISNIQHLPALNEFTTEFYYWREYADRCGLADLPALLTDPSICKKANEILEKVGK